MKLKTRRYIFFTLTIIWLAVIYYFSYMNGDASGDLSSSVTYQLLRWFYPHFNQFDIHEQMVVLDNFHVFVRKMGHFSEYAVLWFFTYQFLRTYSLSKRQCYLGAVVFCFGYASLDEWHQSFVPGRGPSFKDVLIDTSGSLVGGFVYTSLEKIFFKYLKD